ncbi:hypothetical protein [Petrachloros mirabilis]
MLAEYLDPWNPSAVFICLACRPVMRRWVMLDVCMILMPEFSAELPALLDGNGNLARDNTPSWLIYDLPWYRIEGMKNSRGEPYEFCDFHWERMWVDGQIMLYGNPEAERPKGVIYAESTCV